MNILISACLLGAHCRYDGNGNYTDNIETLIKAGHHLIPICPEQLGGLSTPRLPAERLGDRVLTKNQDDVTDAFKKGAIEVKHIAALFQCQLAILKERSPSCGNGLIYDGTFQKKLISGRGVTADLLIKNNIHVIGESQIPEFLSKS